MELILKNERDLEALCRVESFRGSGPGGQKRNKTSSGIRLTLPLAPSEEGDLPTALSVRAEEHREKDLNRKAALQRLRLELALLPLPLPERSPGELLSSQEGTNVLFPSLSGSGEIPSFRSRCNANHFHFPFFVLLSLTLLRLERGEVLPVASLLHVTPSALIRFFKIHKKVWNRVQEIRSLFGRTPLH